MKQINSRKTLKFVLPVLALAFAIGVAFAFKPAPAKNESPKKRADVVLAFQYQLTSSPSAAAAASQANWQKINPDDMCSTTTNQIPCSFSIHVPAGSESLYVNATTGQPTSRVSIQANQDVTTSQYYVSDVKDAGASGSPSIVQDLNNRAKP